MPTWEEFKKKKKTIEGQNRILQTHAPRQATNNVVSNTVKNNSNSTWDRVLNATNTILNDTGTFFKGLGLGVKSGGESAIRQIEYLTQQRDENYRRFREDQTKLKEATENLTIEERINRQNKKLEDSAIVNGVIVKKKTDINDTAIMKEFDKQQEKTNQQILENAEKAKTKLGKYYAGNVAPSMGQSLVGTGLDLIAPGMGSSYRLLSYSGNYTQDALGNGMKEKESAMYGLTMGAVESAMDALGDKLKGKLIGNAKTTKGFKNFIKSGAKELGINAFFEGSGEALTEPLQEIIKQQYGGSANYEKILERMGKSFLAGVASEALMSGVSLGYGGSINLINKIQNGEQISTTEVSDALKEINNKEEIDITKILVNKLGLNAQDLYINKDANQKTNNKLENISTELSRSESKAILDKNQVPTIENKPISEQSQQVISNEDKTAENGTSQETKENDKYAIKIPNSNYKFVKSGDEKIDNFRQDVSQNWNNSKDTQKLVSTIETIMKDKGVAVRLDANLKDADGNIANGKYENGTITINPNSKRAFEYIATHELTHAIGTKQMLDMVQRYRQDNNEFNSKVETLLKNYNATELTEEALADVSAQLFGTQEFIANVKNTNPNLFQKIYNEIKYLWHQLRGYKNENQFIEDLYNKWTQAYNSDKKLNDTTNYYIEPVAKFDETEYNNVIEEKLGKKEYAILRNIINSDSNIKPGINYVEVTNGRYTIYYKGFDDFKVMSRKVDVDAGRINKRNDTTGRKARYSKTFEQSIGNEGTTTSNDEISVFNTSGTRERSRSNTSSSTNIENGIRLPTQESENNSGSFNLQKNNYRGSHQIENAKRITELDLSDIENRVKKVNGYLSKQDNSDLNKLKRILKSPNEKVKIYRASPVHELNSGDWVTTDKLYAKNVAKENGGKVYEYDIDASELYYPDNVKDLPSLHRLSSFQYVGDVRYSKENTEWQEYLEEHFKTEGTRTTKEQIGLPRAKEIPQKNVKNGLLQESVLRQNVTNSKRYTTKNETDEEIAKILETPVTRQKPKDRMWAIMKANILDKGIVFEDLSKRADNRELEAKWDYTLTSGARAQNAIGNKRYDLSGNVISKGLTEIMDEVGDKINDFQNYMYHQLNVDRMTLKDRLGIDNKPVFGDKIGADYSQRKIAEYEESNPKFKEWAKDVYDYLKADKAELVKNGVISEELSKKFEELYPHYVPIQRADKLGNAINVPLDTRRTGINTPIKKAKGGSSDINPLFQTMANRTMQTYRASARNSLGVELKNTLQKLNEFKSNESNIEDLDNIIETVSNEAQTDELLKASKEGRLPTFTVFENGNKVTFDISEDMYDALKPASESTKGLWFKGIPNKISNIRRGVLTEYNPLFSITNTIKDTQDVLMNSQHAIKTYLKYPEAYTQIMKKGYWYNEYMQNGGGQNTYFKDGDFEVKKTGKLPKAKQVLTLPLRAISKVNGAIEMAPRLAEYIASRESGRSMQTSMLDASRVTTNFKAGGDFTKALNRNGFTFLNAGVQGTMQAVRNVREANAQGLKGWTVLACKMAVAGAPVWILNHLMWEDDEDYEQLQDYVKDSYYIVAKKDDGTFIRIPKGRTLAVIQKVVSNVDKYMNNNEELNIDNLSADFWETLKFGVENLAPNNPLDNNVASPIVQTLTNTSWYGEDIVPERLQNVPKAEQFDETTDKFSKWLGEKLNVSPMKINYLLDQYGGGISDLLLPLGTPQAENTPLEDKFVTDPVMKSKYPGEFFEKADKLDIASNSMYATDTDIVKGKYMSYIQNNMSKLYKEKREIQNSTYSDKIKKEKLKEVQEQINETAKMAIEEVENAKITSTTAIIGTEGFYKDSDGEWKRIKEEDRISNVKIQTYSDYKVKKEQKTDKKRREKNNDKATLNDTEIIEIIKNSNYTDKEKDALFDDQINDKTYKNLKLLNKNNISKINQYMDYKTADLDSDKKDDGTKNGKSIYGSKEKKITTYLNNSSFNTIERLYLYGQTYKLSNEQRKTLQKHIKQLNLTSEEQKQIYLDLASSNVEELKDGRIRWK